MLARSHLPTQRLLTCGHSAGRPASTSASSPEELHFRRLARMYRLAPVNGVERYDSRVKVGPSTAVVEAPVRPEYTHSAGGLHGSSYFKMLDDAAFFAAQSLNSDNFVVTTSFTTYITRWIASTVTHPPEVPPSLHLATRQASTAGARAAVGCDWDRAIGNEVAHPCGIRGVRSRRHRGGTWQRHLHATPKVPARQGPVV